MSEASSLTGGPSYSLFFEIAMAVGTTVIAMFLCHSRRRNAALPSVETEDLKTAKDTTKDEEKIHNKPTEEKAQNTHTDESTSSLNAENATKPGNKTFSSATTQTDLRPIDERITWKAIVVNAWENPTRRYRSELFVNVDGIVTRSEGFQSEGVVGVGMKQILAKVQ